jgi:DNA-binding NarL/FixJ family response regulator
MRPRKSPSASFVMASTILVIDDDPIAHETIEGLLVREGHTFVHAESAPRAYAILEQTPVDLVICDVCMPEVDGFEVCRTLKADERWRTIPIVLLTALDGEDDMVLGLEAGADEFLSKPVEKVVLRARVRAMLRIREQYTSLARPRDLGALMIERRERLAAEANLSVREREVLELLMLGRTQDEIGTALGISPRTAKFHQANVLHKLGADSRSDLLRVLLG